MSEREMDSDFRFRKLNQEIRCNVLCECVFLFVWKLKLLSIGATCRGHSYCESSRGFMMEDDAPAKRRYRVLRAQ